MREDVREIVMIICDSEKVGEENIVGSVKISIDEIYERNSDEKTEYLMREDGLRTISKLMFSYKVEPSKVFINF